MAFNGSPITVTASATVLLDGSGAGDKRGGASGTFIPRGLIYVGGSDVNTTDKGCAVQAGQPLAVTAEPGEKLYAITASGSVVVDAVRQGV